MFFCKKKKGGFELTPNEVLSCDVRRLSDELRRLKNDLFILGHCTNPLEHKLIYGEPYYDDCRKDALEDGFVLKAITPDKHYEVWVKQPSKDEIPKTC